MSTDSQIFTLDENGEFQIGIERDKLDDIIDNKFSETDFDVNADIYEQLSEGNKRALYHLVKASQILDAVFLKQDHPDNIRIKAAFANAASDNETVRKAGILFKIFNGIEGRDMYAPKSASLPIFANRKLHDGKGFYPQDLTREELVNYVVEHPEQASAIFSNNTMVVREGERLKAVPYSVFFREEMEGAAAELFKAATLTDHEGFANYLRWQGQALVNDSDPEMVFNAEKAWIDMEDTPLEFTIGRENYYDRFSGDVASDPRVKEVLDLYGIKAKSKDTIGVRVGIVNTESYNLIAQCKKHLDSFKSQMPFYEEYQSSDAEELKMTFADVDLVAISGMYTAIRTGITLANNLPNDDKLSVQLGHGSRMVFNRQVRQISDPERDEKFKNLIIDPVQHQFYDKSAEFSFVIGHELSHSLGPVATRDGRDKGNALGKWGSIIEENKADMASTIMTGYLLEQGVFSQEWANKIYMSWFAKSLQDKEPTPNEAHKYRSVMQFNYFRENGALELELGGKLKIVPEKMVPVARQMLEEIIQLQLAGDAVEAESFATRYGAWNNALQFIADQKMSLNPKLYRLVNLPMAERVMALGLN